MELLKLLSTSEIVAQVISFLILFFLLRVFAWKRILKTLDDRKARIALELKSIEDAKKEIANVKLGYEEKLEAIQRLAKQKLEEAVREGKKITEDFRKKAYEDAQEIINKARQDIKYELFRAKEELKEKVVELAIGAAQNLIKERLTQDDDKKLVKEFLDSIEEDK